METELCCRRHSYRASLFLAGPDRSFDRPKIWLKPVRCSTTALASSPAALDLLSPLEQLTKSEPYPAAAVAVNGLFGSPLSKMELVHAGLKSEAVVSGYHADNIAPSLIGGFVLVRSYTPLDLIPLGFPRGKQLFFVLATPEFEAPTKEMRKAVPGTIELKRHTANCSQAAALVAAILGGNAALLGDALASDTIVEPARSPLIPGMAAVKVLSMRHGALGCTISGAGPTAVAVTDDESKTGAIGASMVLGFREHGKLRSAFSVHKLNTDGALLVETN